VLSREVASELQMRIGQRKLAMLEVRERFQNTKSWLNFTPKPAGLLQEEF
jgi:hypothetical protein